jgi:hypothetical protein
MNKFLFFSISFNSFLFIYSIWILYIKNKIQKTQTINYLNIFLNYLKQIIAILITYSFIHFLKLENIFVFIYAMINILLFSNIIEIIDINSFNISLLNNKDKFKLEKIHFSFLFIFIIFSTISLLFFLLK